eukprot:SAG31_NODE_897_length_11148_cov_15.102815_1_plen_50_part_10
MGALQVHLHGIANFQVHHYTAKYSRINSYLKLQRWTEYSNYPLQHLPAPI